MMGEFNHAIINEETENGKYRRASISFSDWFRDNEEFIRGGIREIICMPDYKPYHKARTKIYLDEVTVEHVHFPHEKDFELDQVIVENTETNWKMIFTVLFVPPVDNFKKKLTYGNLFQGDIRLMLELRQYLEHLVQAGKATLLDDNSIRITDKALLKQILDYLYENP